MTNRAFFSLTASGLVFTALLGCTGLDLTRVSPGGNPDQLAASAGKSADSYRKLAAKGDQAGALVAAEGAVAADPDNGAYRALLGHAYLSAGRFASAQTAFEDAIALGNVDGRTAVSLALALAANGDGAESVRVLDDHREMITASDYGLALALAGEPERAVLVLGNAARADDATAQTRQNLAFAYAMSGHWLEAKLLAAQDMSIAKLDGRMTEWAALIQAENPQQRVAGLMGVTPNVADAGLPVRLALVDAPGAQAALAKEAVLDMASYNPVSNAPEVDYVAPIDVPTEFAMAQPIAAPMPAPVMTNDFAADQAEAEPYREAAAELLAINVARDTTPVETSALDRVAAAAPIDQPLPTTSASRFARADPLPAVKASRKADARSGWAVQLGAFSSNVNAQRAWGAYSKRFASLGGYAATSHYATVSGKGYFRLTANGVGSRTEANTLCGAVKASGGVCFVRNLSGREDVRWASRDTTTRVASR